MRCLAQDHEIWDATKVLAKRMQNVAVPKHKAELAARSATHQVHEIALSSFTLT